ncbi:hypothetical protein ACFLSJ_01420 [Verrucomicrobiota bacterium]
MKGFKLTIHPIMVCVLLMPFLSLAATLRVWTNSSRLADPYDSRSYAAHEIQAAIDAASDGDVVLVANGSYVVTTAVVVAKAVVVRSVSGPDLTVVDGNHSSRCFYIDHTNAVIEGFTIRNGYSLYSGGGVRIASGGTIRDCVIAGNRAEINGGGLLIEHDEGVIENCVIRQNSAGGGGGVYMQSGGCLSGCLVSSNGVRWTGGGIQCRYGGMVRNCVISHNSSRASGGGIWSGGGTIENCVISRNRAWYNSVAVGGGVVSVGARVRNCTIAYNSCDDYGGGMYVRGGG